MGCQVRQLERASHTEIRCLAVVFLIVAAVHGVLATVESVAWPIVVAVTCVGCAMALERLALVQGRPNGRGRDAAHRILKEGWAALPGVDPAEPDERRPRAGSRRR